MKNFSYVQIDILDDSVKSLLAQQYAIEPLDIEDVYTNTQLSKIEQRKDYLYVILEFPQYLKQTKQFIVKEIHCFVGHDFFLVIDKHGYDYFKEFASLYSSADQTVSSSFGMFCEMLDYIITRIFPVVGKFRTEIGFIEEQVFDDIENDLLPDILIVRKNVVNFMSIMYPLELCVHDLQFKYTKFVGVDDQEKLDDSLDKIKKMLNNLSNFKEQITMLNETNEAQIARSTNRTVRTLTAINIIIFVPSLIAAIFGMNIYFGWQPDTTSFMPLIVIICIMFVASSGSIAYFRYKKLI